MNELKEALKNRIKELSEYGVIEPVISPLLKKENERILMMLKNRLSGKCRNCEKTKKGVYEKD